MPSAAMAIVGAVVLATANELLAFLTLSLLLQIGVAADYLAPILSKSTMFAETSGIYALFGLHFVLTFYAVPAIVGLINAYEGAAVQTSAAATAPKSRYALQLERLPADMTRNLVMMLAALFLATVNKVAFHVRVELAAAQLLASVAFVAARLIGAEVAEIYASAIMRLCCLSLVGYAVVPSFDSSFSGLVSQSARLVGRYAHNVKTILRLG